MSRKSSPSPAPKSAGAKPGPKPEAKAPTPEGERIAKVLSRAGVASRREAERLIEAGLVKVNGRVIDSPALNVTARDKIIVDGKPLAPPEPARLWLYYKPEGLVTSASDEKGRPTVFDSLPEDMPRVMSVGRLDLNSEGLLLLTNDGELKRRLELPSTGWLRKYRVRVHGNPTDADLEPLRKGIVAEGEKFQPMTVTLDRVQGANAWLTVGLREGRNREVRRAMAEIGLTVNRLIRISYGPFRLNELQPGEVEEVRPRVLKDQLGLSVEDHEAASAARVARTRTGTRPTARTDAPAQPAPKGPRTSREPDQKAPSARRPAAKGAAAPATGAAPRSGPKARPSAALRELSDTWTEAVTPRAPRGRASAAKATVTGGKPGFKAEKAASARPPRPVSDTRKGPAKPAGPSGKPTRRPPRKGE